MKADAKVQDEVREDISAKKKEFDQEIPAGESFKHSHAPSENIPSDYELPPP